MKKTILLIFAVLILILLAGAIAQGMGIIDLRKIKIFNNNPRQDVSQNNNLAPKLPDPEEQLEKIKQEKPEIITGIIKFLDTKSVFKTTITSADGKTYILYPAQPKSIYESYGVKNGQKVQINAKLLENGQIEWALLRAAQ